MRWQQVVVSVSANQNQVTSCGSGIGEDIVRVGGRHPGGRTCGNVQTVRVKVERQERFRGKPQGRCYGESVQTRARYPEQERR